eukprot:scaffold1916_cov123-Isochrysis_galbana.AAC.13
MAPFSTGTRPRAEAATPGESIASSVSPSPTAATPVPPTAERARPRRRSREGGGGSNDSMPSASRSSACGAPSGGGRASVAGRPAMRNGRSRMISESR